MKQVALFRFSHTKLPPGYEALFSERGVSLRQYCDVTSEQEILKACNGMDAIITIVTPFTGDMIQKLPDTLRAIVVAAMGYDHVDVAAAKARGIQVCNVPDYAVEEVAVHQMSLMLAALRKVCMYNKVVHEGGWVEPDYNDGYPIHRLSTLSYGLLGFGRIARRVSHYAKSFGMKVYAYDPYVDKAVMADCGVIRADTVDEIYENCDIVSPNVPLEDELVHMIDADAIHKMKDNVIIVNTGRGALIDEKALCDGLKRGKIQAAALDVFEKEPFSDTNHPLMQMDNVILTPHIAYLTEESGRDVMMRAAKSAITAALGGEPEGLVTGGNS